MKKFLAIIAIASFAVACNGSGDKTETKDTTVTPTGDTVTKTITTDTVTNNSGDTTTTKKVETDTTKH